MPATFDELYDAAYKAAFQRGLEVETQDRKHGRISGKGNWQMVCGAGPCNMLVTFAAYVEEIDRAPTTKLTFIVDRYGITGWGGEETVAQNFLIEVQKALAAQR